jgi:hypothetical protein
MSDEELELSVDPMPALPLEYFDRRSGPWVAVVRLVAWVGIFYAGIVIASELAWVLELLRESFSRPIGFRSSVQNNIVAGVLPAIDAIALLVGGTMSLQRDRAGRIILLASSAGAVACVMVSFLITLGMIMSRYPANYPPIWLILIQQLIGGFFLMLYRLIVPVLLWIVFRKREVREVFDAS